MTEDDAKTQMKSLGHVSRETWDRLERYVALLLAEARQQNLISASTIDQVWARHILDSAQLLKFAPHPNGHNWIDLGAGAGLPGMVVAILSNWPVVMVETRRMRVDFLARTIADLKLENASVLGMKVEGVEPVQAAIISARAYAPLDRLLRSASHLAGPDTLWLLPKGKNAQKELEEARSSWQGKFHVEHSLTNPDSVIVIAQGVKAISRKGRS